MFTAKIDSGVLQRCVSIAASALPPRAVDERYESIWIESTPEAIVVSGFGASASKHEATATCEVQGQACIAVNARMFLAAVSSMPDGPVELLFDGKKVSLKSAVGILKVLVNVCDRPEIKNRAPNLLFECPKAPLSFAVAACSFTEMSHKGTHAETTCLLGRGGNAVIFSSRSARACYAEIGPADISGVVKLFFDLPDIKRALACCDGEALSVFYGQGAMRIESDSQDISASLEFGLVPSRTCHIDTFAKMEVKAELHFDSTDILSSAVGQASVVKLPEYSSVLVAIGESDIVLAYESDCGLSEMVVPATVVSGQKVSFSADLDDLAGFMKNIKRCGPAKMSLLSLGGQDRAIMLANENGSLRMFAALVERN